MYGAVFSDEFLFYIGVIIFAGSMLCFLLLSLIFHIRKRKLNELFDREYGSKIGKDGHLDEQGKRKRKGAG